MSNLFKLVVAMFEAVNAGQGLIKGLQGSKVFRFVVLDFQAERIHQLQWIMVQFIVILGPFNQRRE